MLLSREQGEKMGCLVIEKPPNQCRNVIYKSLDMFHSLFNHFVFNWNESKILKVFSQIHFTWFWGMGLQMGCRMMDKPPNQARNVI